MARFPIAAAESLADRVSEIVGARVPPRLAVKIAKAMMSAVEKAALAEGEVAIQGHGKFAIRPHPIYPATGERCKDRVTICYLPSRAAKDRMSKQMSKMASKTKRRK